MIFVRIKTTIWPDISMLKVDISRLFQKCKLFEETLTQMIRTIYERRNLSILYFEKKYWVLSLLIFHFSKLYRKLFKPKIHSHKISGKARASIYKISINGFSLEIASLMRNDITKMHWKMSSPEYWYEKRKNKLFYSSLDVMIILSLSSDEWSKRKEKCQSFHLRSFLMQSYDTLMNAWKYVNAQ